MKMISQILCNLPQTQYYFDIVLRNEAQDDYCEIHLCFSFHHFSLLHFYLASRTREPFSIT